jgi:hypothetical protein
MIGVLIVGALGWGLLTVVRSNMELGRNSIGVELDASRRWVTLTHVHPRFAAAMADHARDLASVAPQR